MKEVPRAVPQRSVHQRRPRETTFTPSAFRGCHRRCHRPERLARGADENSASCANPSGTRVRSHAGCDARALCPGVLRSGASTALRVHHAEARRAFEESARFDQQLAMAYWGQAMTWAPNLNAPMTVEGGRRALEAMQRARRATGASPRDRALVDALFQRFSSNPAAP